ncbi:MAG TPA: winged helix-turn-helix domain-containing protein [Edaphobacter sp.]|jgi:cholera toxin transcriptional activator|nr:winged helix-turn-helix domain-containing protein [Edaphobacter sp.]
MLETQPPRRYRFGVFEADSTTGELRRKGIRVKLHSQPFQVLFMLLERPGELLTREEISRELWPGGTFVDYEHGVNSAVNRLREALGDKASNPRFIETLARRGYRFVAPVEKIIPNEASSTAPEPRLSEELSKTLTTPPQPPDPKPALFSKVLATPEDLPKTSHLVVQILFVLLQLMYIGFYVGALANLDEIGELLAVLPFARQGLVVIIVTATILIPVRTFLVSAVLFYAPRIREKFQKMWWLLLPFDLLWSLSPFLLLHHINFGLALACVTFLVYSPFAQRSLILMGAGQFRSQITA